MAREYEVKILVEGASFDATSNFLKEQLMQVCVSFKEGTSVDAYWRTAQEAKGSFLRLRMSNDQVVLTTKINDKNSITDRNELNVDIPFSQKELALEVLTATLSDATFLMWKYINFNIGTTTISVIKNLEKPEFTFLEIESSTNDEVAFWRKRLADASQVNLKQVKNSFFEIFVLRQGILL